MAEMTKDQVVLVVEMWIEEMNKMDPSWYVQIFENKGQAMGGN